MAYTKNSTWVEGTAPGISAARLNNLETQYDEVLASSLTFAGTKTFSTIPELPASNPTTANQATRKLYVDGLVKEVFLSAPMGLGNGTLEQSSLWGSLRPVWVCANGELRYVEWSWRIPISFVSISSIKVIWASSGLGNMYWRLYAEWATDNEHGNAHAETGDLGATANQGDEHINVQAPLDPLTLSGLASGDILAVKFYRDAIDALDTIADSVDILGLLITYT